VGGVLWLPKNVSAQEAKKSKPNLKTEADLLGLSRQTQAPITITSEKAEFDNKQHMATYTGNVVVKRGDMTLYATHIKAWFDPVVRRIQKITAQGQLKIVQGDRVITAAQGTYFAEGQKIVLTGKPVSQQGDNMVQGSRMTYFLDEDRIVVEEARTVLHPKSHKTKAP